MAPFTLKLTKKKCSSFPRNFEHRWFGSHSSQGRNVSTSRHNGSIELESENASWTFWTSYTIHPLARKKGVGVTLNEVLELGLLLLNAGKEDYV